MGEYSLPLAIIGGLLVSILIQLNMIATKLDRRVGKKEADKTQGNNKKI